MTTIILVFTTLIGLGLAIYNGWIYKMAIQRNIHYNTLNHLISGSIRAICFILILVLGLIWKIPAERLIFLLLYALIFFWPVYNLIYNAIHNNRWYYLGSRNSNTRSWIDRWFGKVILPVQGFLILATILWYPLNLYESFTERWLDWVISIVLISAFCIIGHNFYTKKWTFTRK